MRYKSTRNENEIVTSTRAIINGLAHDGGLYVPDDLEAIKVDYSELIKMSYMDMAKVIFGIFFGDFDAEKISEIVERSYTGKFSGGEVAPLVKAADAYVLELYHGPTSAFKDVALSALPNLMTEAAAAENIKEKILILTATSGDTGSAALHGFSDVPGTSIIVFYPHEGVSETQRLQMVTAKAKNTLACGVKGSFDDAQYGVKEIFRQNLLSKEGVSLSSANSINIGRLVPQIVYYFSAYGQLVGSGAIGVGDEVSFSVPTGNFGNILAGYLAKRMGLPIGKLICASNENDVLTDFLETGRYDRKRELLKTTSPSMDILVSSNLERLLYFVCGSDRVNEMMTSLSETGEYVVSDEELSIIRESFEFAHCGSEGAGRAIRELFESDRYLMDTHTAVAWSAFRQLKAVGKIQTACPCVVISTASPYKFSEAVLKALGFESTGSDEGNMKLLQEITGAEVPGALAQVFNKEVRHGDIIEKEEMSKYVEEHMDKTHAI